MTDHVPQPSADSDEPAPDQQNSGKSPQNPSENQQISGDNPQIEPADLPLKPMDSSQFLRMNKWKYFQMVGYHPHPRQRLFHQSAARFKVPICGRRFGKSIMAAREIIPDLFLPNRRYWIVGPTYDLGEKEFRVIWDDLIIKLGMGRQREIKRSYSKKQGDLSIEFPWGTRLEVRSADRPENLVGEGLHGVIMSEAAKHLEETWDRFIRPALTDYHGSATFPTTPEGQNWLYKLWKMGRDPEYPDFESWQFPSWENPHVYPLGKEDPELLLTMKTTPEESFAQEYGADFTSFSGKIYKEWDEGTHVQQVKFVPTLPNYIAFDWGYCVDPTTEILTRRGWLTYAELQKDIDEVVTINPGTGLSEWQTLQDVHTFTGTFDMISMQGNRHSSLTTANHRWLTHNKADDDFKFVTTENLKYKDTIPTAATFIDLPMETKYSDAFVELAAWFWTEGSWYTNQNGALWQNPGSNAERIRGCFTTLFGPARETLRSGKAVGRAGWRETPHGSRLVRKFVFNKAVGEALEAVMSDVANKVLSMEFLLSLTKAQLELFIQVSMLADGHNRPDSNSNSLGQSHFGRASMFQTACILAGYSTNMYHRADINQWVVGHSKPKNLNPIAAASMDGKFTINRFAYVGTVWCPTTPNGTWLARRNGSVYFTGNTAPMAAIEFQIDAFGRVRVWREHYKAHTRLRDFLNELKYRTQPDGYHLDLTFGDAADPEAVVTVSEDFCQCYADPRSKSGTQGGSLESGWREGVELVKGMLKLQEVDQDEFGTPIEQPWLIVDHSCINIVREFNNYRAASAVRGKDPREAAHKSDDHALDALRYGLMHYFKLGATASLSDVMNVTDMTDLPDQGYFTSMKHFA